MKNKTDILNKPNQTTANYSEAECDDYVSSLGLKERLKILSFSALIKLNIKNGVVNNSMSLRYLSKTLGVSHNTYTKYLNKSLRSGVCTVNKNGHIVFSGHKKAVFKLNLTDTVTKTVYYFNKPGYIGKVTLNKIFSTLTESIIYKNLSQQKFKIDKKEEVIEVANKLIYNRKIASKRELTIAKQIMKEAAALGRKTTFHAKCIVIKNKSNCGYIVTGKNHVSKMIGMSMSTSKNRINSMLKKGIITDKNTVVKVINTQDSKSVNTYFTYIKQYNKYINSNTSLYTILGTKVSIIDSNTYTSILSSI